MTDSAAQKAVATSIALAANESWLKKRTRDAEHSPSAAAMLREIMMRDPAKLATLDAQDRLVDGITAKIIDSKTSSERIDLSTQWTLRLWESKDAADQAYDQLITQYA
jgi:hypothetical protein